MEICHTLHGETNDLVRYFEIVKGIRNLKDAVKFEFSLTMPTQAFNFVDVSM